MPDSDDEATLTDYCIVLALTIASVLVFGPAFVVLGALWP